MAYRHKMNKRSDKKYFSKTAGKVQKKNVPSVYSMPMRGGIRL